MNPKLPDINFNSLGPMKDIMKDIEEAVQEKQTRDLSSRLYDNINNQINLFYDSLEKDEWLSIFLLCGNGLQLLVTDIKAVHPNALIVTCKNGENEECSVFTHMNMLQLLLRKYKSTSDNDSTIHRRIGFSM